MKYYYDIKLNFNLEPVQYYEWDLSNCERFIKIPVFKVKDIEDIIKNISSFDVSEDIFIVSDTINALAIKLVNKQSIYISNLSYRDEESINELVFNMDYRDLKIKHLKKRNINFGLKEDLEIKNNLLNVIKTSDNDLIEYIYFSLFENKKCLDKRKFLINYINDDFNSECINVYNEIKSY